MAAVDRYPRNNPFYTASMAQATQLFEARRRKELAGTVAVGRSEGRINEVARSAITADVDLKPIDKHLEKQKDKLSSVAVFFGNAQSTDRAVKVLTNGAELGVQLLAGTRVDPAFQSGVHALGMGCRVARTIFAFPNAFRGAGEGIIYALPLLKNMVVAIYKGNTRVEEGYTVEAGDAKFFDKAYLNETQKTILVGKQFTITTREGAEVQVGELDRIRFNLDRSITIERGLKGFNPTTADFSIYRGTKELIVGLISQFFHMIAAMAYVVGFAICSPIRCLDEYFKGYFGENAKWLGKQFGFALMITHFAATVGSVADLVHTGTVYANSERGDEAAVRKFYEQIIQIVIFMVKTACEIVADAFSVFKAHGPPVVKLVASFAAASIDLWRSIRDLELKNENDLRKHAADDAANIIRSLPQAI